MGRAALATIVYRRCTRKVRYSSEEAARITLEKYEAQDTMTAYFCEHCHGWHNGHRRKGAS